MNVNIHPLQEKTAALLKALYFERHLPVTRAMHSVIDGYYPSIESILGTLSHYKDEEVVRAFAVSNSEVIRIAKEELENRKETVSENPSGTGMFADIFNSPFEIVSAFESMKGTPVSAIESALSDALSRLCGEELVLEVESIARGGGTLESNAELKIVVKPKRNVR